MSGSPTCPSCGFTNLPGAKFCTRCGKDIGSMLSPHPTSVPTQIPVYPGYVPVRPKDYIVAFMNPEKRKRVNRTRTGVFLLIMGIILAPLPALVFLAGIILWAGAVRIFLGRQAFGQKHQRHCKWSLATMILGVIAESAALFWFSFSVTLAQSSGATENDLAQTLSSSYNNSLISLIVTGALIGVALVFFTYEIQNPPGRFLLWFAYGLTVILDIVNYSIISPQLPGASHDVVSRLGSSGNLTGALAAQFPYLRLLGLIPAIPYTVAYYFSWSQVERKSMLETATPPNTSISR